MYSCGPTVYDTAHIGNFRTFITNDLVKRIFIYNGYDVEHVMNITDIDDKTIKRSIAEDTKLNVLTKHYEDAFLRDIHSLNIVTPNKVLRATEYINQMISMISTLIAKGIAYKTKDGIYFSIALSKNYGELAKLKIASTDTTTLQERISNDEYEKENPRDFALWKFHSNEDGEIKYDAPFGAGRPGWHIECSAMSVDALGPNIDIHTGGTDLIFPHHTNEIAQSEACTGKHFVNYWVHTAFMNVNDTKMSKSKGNFLKLNDLVELGISPLAYRYWLLTSHYRSQVNFTVDAVKAAQTAYIRLVETFIRLGEVKNEHVHASANPRDYKKKFGESINDDFNTPEALALTWDLIKDHSVLAKDKISLLLDFDAVFGLGLNAVMQMKNDEVSNIPAEITLLAEAREMARKEKEWDKADALRKEIESRGYTVKDTEGGVEVRENR